MARLVDRRDVLMAAGAVGAAGLWPGAAAPASDEALETTTVRLTTDAGICIAPQYLAGELLRRDGFTDVQFVPAMKGPAGAVMVGRSEADFTATFAASVILPIDEGEQVTVLAGLHRGCYELFAQPAIASIGDLAGRRVGVPALRSSPHLYLSVMAAHVGLDPERDIDWVTGSTTEPMELYAAGEIDAFLGFPPEPQALRARGIGRVLLDTATERPWSQYYCCMLLGNRQFVQDHPVATKRVLRAIFRSVDYCAAEPQAAARRLVERGFADRLDYATRTLEEVPFAEWRDYDPEDTMRFYALRLHEVGMIRSDPNRIIEAGTDWRFLDAIRRELKT
jgi:NitT/TauT family transport system substrate-binding protein